MSLSDPIIISAIIAGTLATMGTLLGVSITYFFTARSAAVIKKTRLEAKERLKTDSVLEVIEGVEIFDAAIFAIIQDVVKLAIMIEGKYSGKIANLESIRMTEEISKSLEAILTSDSIGMMLATASVELKNSNRKPNKDIEKIIFLLNKDIIINGENEKITKQISRIIRLYHKIQTSFEIEYREKDKKAVLAELQKIRVDNMVDVSSEATEISNAILRIYKEKIN